MLDRGGFQDSNNTNRHAFVGSRAEIDAAMEEEKQQSNPDADDFVNI